MGATLTLDPNAQTTAALEARIGPDMRQLWRQFPPRPAVPSWPTTEQDREGLLARLLDAPFAGADAAGGSRRRTGLVRLLDWLSCHPGRTWQQRWVASGADDSGNADWWRPMQARLRPLNPQGGVSLASNLRVCAVLLVCADAIRPSLGWMLTPRAPQNLVALMAATRDPAGFAELTARCEATSAGRTMKTVALRRAATILAVKGGTLGDITVGDCLELSVAVDGRSARRNRALGFYQLLHSMGVFGPEAPATIRAFGTQGQLSPAQLIDRYGIVCRPVRDVLVAYLQERQPAVDHTTLHNLALSLGGLFWRDLERHHPGIDSLRLQPAVAAAWKQRLLTKTRRVAGPNGEISEVREPRAAGLHSMGAVRAFYLDIAQWAMEAPAGGHPGPRRARSGRRTWRTRRRSAPASHARTNAPGNGSPCCPSWSPACTPRGPTAPPCCTPPPLPPRAACSPSAVSASAGSSPSRTGLSESGPKTPAPAPMTVNAVT